MHPLTAPSVPTEPTDHSVRFYDHDDLLLQEVSEYLDEALSAGGLAVAIATEPHRRELARRLSGTGPMLEVGTGWFSGQLVLLDAEETLGRFMVDGYPDPAAFEATIGALFAKTEAGRPLRAFGEMVAVLCERGAYEAALLLEALWNDLATKYRFSLFCAYPRRLFSSADHVLAFQHVCAAHTHVLEPTDVVDDSVVDQGSQIVVRLREQVRRLQAEFERGKATDRVRRQRERELVEFLDNASEGIHKVAGDGTILYANQAELDLMGYSWPEYVGHNIAEFYVDGQLACDILRRLGAGEVLRDQPAQLVRKDGSHVPVLICSNAYRVNGELIYTRCFTRDATERVAREQALEEARRILERAAEEREQMLEQVREASRAKDEFLAMLGHELRNPLSPIVTALQLMRMKGETGTAREQAVIQRQVAHMVRLIDDLLDVSRIIRGKIELQFEETDIAAIVARAVEQADVLLEQRSHRLDIELEPGLRCYCDPVRIAQAVANLLTNAARYTDIGGHIRLRAWRESEQTLAVSVHDNGRGIAPHVLPRVFDLFYQAPRSVERSEGGLGIGLALVRNFLELHGGSVHVTSAGLRRGSEFTIRLPARVQLSAAPDTLPVSQGASSAAACKTVLLVDDNEDAASTLSDFLRSHGYEVLVFSEPVGALQWLESQTPDVAVLDIGLPVMDGYELGARVRERCPDCQMIALSGYGQEADKARARQAGFRHHLTKPVAPSGLLELLHTLQ